MSHSTLILAFAALTIALVSTRVDCGTGTPGDYSLGDLLVVFPTASLTFDYVQASRAWRRGVRTHIVVDPSQDLKTLKRIGAFYNEEYSVTPDFPDHWGAFGGIRHALSPLMAHGKDDAERKRYKWMLLGDDDTIWVLPAVLRMLNERKLSHMEPHLISDYHYHCVNPHVPCLGPHNFDPRCLPCPPGVFCPCRLPPGCALKEFFNYTDCPFKEIIAAYGGGGIIFSQSLIQAMFQPGQPDFYWQVVMKRVTPGTPAGDLALGEAPRQLGIGYTRLFYDDPQKMPPAAPPPPPVHDQHTGDRLFGTWSQFNDHGHPNDILYRHESAAHQHPDMFRKMVTVHMRSRNFYGIPWNLTEVFAAYEKMVHLLYRVHSHHNHTGPAQVPNQ